MTTIFIIHCSNGDPERHWYPWLKDKLKQQGNEVIVPQFPIGENQSLKNWQDMFKQYENKLNDSILVGHSLGVPFIINILNTIDKTIKATFFISGFIGHLQLKGEPNLNQFSDRLFNWNHINQHCQSFNIIHSDNDPYVPLNKAEELATLLGKKPIIIQNAGHFQEQKGYKQFPYLLELIQEEV